MSEPLVRCVSVTKTFRRGSRFITAVDAVTLDLYPGEVLGLLGQSGCGKTTLCRTIAGLYGVDGGSVFRAPSLRRPGAVGFAFQHPQRSLNPFRSVLSSVREPLDAFFPHMSRQERLGIVTAALERLGVPIEAVKRLPGEISGGQAQRAVLARALVTDPELLLLDEPVSALDAPAGSAVLNCIKEVCETGPAALFVTHDPAAAGFLCRRTAVMFAGRVVESGFTAQVLHRPRHPYTRYLLDSMPPYSDYSVCPPTGMEHWREGCAFVALCPRRLERCLHAFPPLQGDGLLCFNPLGGEGA